MSISRDLLSAYRKFQYKVCGRLEYGTMPPGELCTHTPFKEESNRGDVVHPCVRYADNKSLDILIILMPFLETLLMAYGVLAVWN